MEESCVFVGSNSSNCVVSVPIKMYRVLVHRNSRCRPTFANKTRLTLSRLASPRLASPRQRFSPPTPKSRRVPVPCTHRACTHRACTHRTSCVVQVTFPKLLRAILAFSMSTGNRYKHKYIVQLSSLSRSTNRLYQILHPSTYTLHSLPTFSPLRARCYTLLLTRRSISTTATYSNIFCAIPLLQRLRSIHSYDSRTHPQSQPVPRFQLVLN